MRREEQHELQQKEKLMRIQLEDELPSLLDSLNLDGFLVRAFLKDDLLERDDYITLDKECMSRLKDKTREINDTIVLAAMR